MNDKKVSPLEVLAEIGREAGRDIRYVAQKTRNAIALTHAAPTAVQVMRVRSNGRREWRNRDDYFPDESHFGTGLSHQPIKKKSKPLKIVGKFTGIAVNIGLATGYAALAYEDHPEALLIPVATNAVSGAYEIGRHVYINAKNRLLEKKLGFGGLQKYIEDTNNRYEKRSAERKIRKC